MVAIYRFLHVWLLRPHHSVLLWYLTHRRWYRHLLARNAYMNVFIQKCFVEWRAKYPLKKNPVVSKRPQKKMMDGLVLHTFTSSANVVTRQVWFCCRANTWIWGEYDCCMLSTPPPPPTHTHTHTLFHPIQHHHLRLTEWQHIEPWTGDKSLSGFIKTQPGQTEHLIFRCNTQGDSVWEREGEPSCLVCSPAGNYCLLSDVIKAEVEEE